MMALLTLMGSGRPTAEDLNSLMVATRDLKKHLPEGSDISDFIGIEGFEDMALPEAGDVIQYVNGEPVLMTNFGESKARFLSLIYQIHVSYDSKLHF